MLAGYTCPIASLLGPLFLLKHLSAVSGSCPEACLSFLSFSVHWLLCFLALPLFTLLTYPSFFYPTVLSVTLSLLYTPFMITSNPLLCPLPLPPAILSLFWYRCPLLRRGSMSGGQSPVTLSSLPSCSAIATPTGLLIPKVNGVARLTSTSTVICGF